MIQNFIASGSPDLSPVAKTFYRPLGSLYCYAVYTVFGMNAAGFHVLAIGILFITALVVRLVAYALTNDDRVAWGSAFLYAIAANIHLDPQMWMVGIFDNGATLFVLLCLYLSMTGRSVLSALCFALALGFKESAVPMLFVVVAYTLLFRPHGEAVRRLWPQVVVFALWAILKGLGASATGIPDNDPYAWNMFGWHVLKNIGLYATWFAPVLVGILFVVPLLFWTCSTKPRIGGFLIVWAILMLLPPSIFLHHAFRYYAILSLPAIAIGVVVGIFELPVSGNWRKTIVVVTVLANFLFSLIFIQGHVRRGINDDVPATNDGYNHLLRRSLQGE
jgi:hypothetical protein